MKGDLWKIEWTKQNLLQGQTRDQCSGNTFLLNIERYHQDTFQNFSIKKANCLEQASQCFHSYRCNHTHGIYVDEYGDHELHKVTNNNWFGMEQLCSTWNGLLDRYIRKMILCVLCPRFSHTSFWNEWLLGCGNCLCSSRTRYCCLWGSWGTGSGMSCGSTIGFHSGTATQPCISPAHNAS